MVSKFRIFKSDLLKSRHWNGLNKITLNITNYSDGEDVLKLKFTEIKKWLFLFQFCNFGDVPTEIPDNRLEEFYNGSFTIIVEWQ